MKWREEVKDINEGWSRNDKEKRWGKVVEHREGSV